jgi:hypothetical protein
MAKIKVSALALLLAVGVSLFSLRQPVYTVTFLAATLALAQADELAGCWKLSPEEKAMLRDVVAKHEAQGKNAMLLVMDIDQVSERALEIAKENDRNPSKSRWLSSSISGCDGERQVYLETETYALSGEIETSTQEPTQPESDPNVLPGKIRKVTKPTPKKTDDRRKKEISDACRKNPDSYTCLYGHEEIMVPKTDPREPFELVIDESVKVQCFEEEWTKWRDDWDQKALKVLNEAKRRFTTLDPNYYQSNFQVRVGPDGRVVKWESLGGLFGTPDPYDRTPPYTRAEMAEHYARAKRTSYEMTNWILDELKKIKAMPFPEGSAMPFVDRTPILYHNFVDQSGRKITGVKPSPIPKEPHKVCQ